MMIGKIVKSDSHITYVCQIYRPREVEVEPSPADYAFGRFVRIVVRSGSDQATPTSDHQAPLVYAVGVIYDTILLNPAFGSPGLHLSSEAQLDVFAPDYRSEQAVLVSILLLGMVQQRQTTADQTGCCSVMHGVPPLSLELESLVEIMNDDAVRAFHFFDDQAGYNRQPCVHVGYLPHLIGQRNSLLPMVTLRIIDQLERLFPQNVSLLSIVKRNFAWRLKVETTG